MLSLKQDNERLQRIVTNKSLTSSQSSLPIPDNNGDQFSYSENTSPTATGKGFANILHVFDFVKTSSLIKQLILSTHQ
jgi:hypothetical protein